MTVNAITDTKKGEQGLRLLIFILPKKFSLVSICGHSTIPNQTTALYLTVLLVNFAVC